MYFTNQELQLYTAESEIRATELIAEAEEMFGPMTSSWIYDGVIFRDNPPHLYYWPEAGSVQISLSFKAFKNDVQRDFQLAHEVCHLLYPSVALGNPEKPATNLINEGISTYFSVLTVSNHGEEIFDSVIKSLADHSPRYFFALSQVTTLLRADKHAVKKIRGIQPMINDVTEAELRTFGFSVPDETFSSLVEKF